MRKVTREEKTKRGCEYCLDYKIKKFQDIRTKVCIHDECPYHELDGFKTYNEYIKSKGALKWLIGTK